MRVLVAPAPYKECADTRTISRLLRNAVLNAIPSAKVTVLELSDGGTGFAEWLLSHTGGMFYNTFASRLDGTRISTKLGIMDAGGTSVIEVAQVLGLALIPPEVRNPLLYTSYGAGELIMEALNLGSTQIILGCGDSGVCDAGLGAARALGFRFLDRYGECIVAGSQDLARIESIDDRNVPTEVRNLRMTIVCNTEYNWSGKHGATRLFGSQKGLTPADIDQLDEAYTHLAEILSFKWKDPRKTDGAGSSGGVAGMFSCLLNADIINYQSFIGRYLDVDQIIGESDLVITGEGTLDQQTLLGKLPAFVAKVAQQNGVPCIAIVGYRSNAGSADALFTKVLTLSQAKLGGYAEYVQALTSMKDKVRALFAEVGNEQY